MRFESRWGSSEAERNNKKKRLFQMVGDTRRKSFQNNHGLNIIRCREMTSAIWRKRRRTGKRSQKANKEMRWELWEFLP